MVRFIVLALALGACATATAQTEPPHEHPAPVELPAPGSHQPGGLETRAAQMQIIGDYADREIRLLFNEEVAFEGRRAHSHTGESWRVDLPPGEGFFTIDLTIEPCEQPYRTRIMPDSAMPTLRIEGCHIVLLD
ncbi:MAG: hypothetical protein AB7O98_04380 [Hyphomonadaceae bacterium]